MHAVLELVRNAAVSGDVEQMEAAECELQDVWNKLRGEPDASSSNRTLPDSYAEACERTSILAAAAAGFYSGMAAIMRMQLQGYGRTGNGGQPQPGSRFAVEG